jgi:hypothetical protein
MGYLVMDAWSILVLAATLALGADISGLTSLRPAPPSLGNIDSPAQTTASAATPPASTPSAGTAVKSADQPPKELQPESRLLLVRYVDGEFAKLMQGMPGGKKGFKIEVGKPIDPQHLSDMLRLYGTVGNQGDTVQITGVEFQPNAIAIQINGGGKKHFHLRDHLEIGGVTPQQSTAPPDKPGGVLILDYGRPLPDMSPDDLKRDLSVMLDFSKQHSSTVNWVDSLPPQFQQAIKDQHAIVGMNQEMVIAAMGRPEHKVRERDADGYDTEDWIYGSPPAPTTFVTFAGDTVVKVKEFN